MQPDYSRQVLLKEIGPLGQETLQKSRVLIVGLGGLGSPVMQYLAGAGVGHLGLVDADVLDASNLHRQPIYALSDVGRPKAELARAAIAAINPAAVLAQRPAVFASVYQYEGQLQVYKPDPKHACLRCLWPDAIADGVVGNCAAAGVLGPVPGAFGTLQALLTLKILLQMGGQLQGELLLLDFMNFSTLKIHAARRTECQAPKCAHIRALAREDRDIEVVWDSLAAAAERGFDVIDIRTAEEVAERPAAARHIPMAELLANPGLLADSRQPLLVCATGKRSLAAALVLRKRGLIVRSLAGGLQNLER